MPSLSLCKSLRCHRSLLTIFLCLVLLTRHSFGFVKTISRFPGYSTLLGKTLETGIVALGEKPDDSSGPDPQRNATGPSPPLPAEELSQSIVVQKNELLLKQFQSDGVREVNVTEVAIAYVNFCDESFNVYLNKKIDDCPTETEKRVLGKIRYEINRARQGKLIEADHILRSILAAGGLKQMEAKLAFHLRRAEIDMAFMVVLQLNVEDANNVGAEKAIQVMTHLGTLINEHQDTMVSAPVRLLRLLVREDDSNVRKQMLRQKLLIGDNVSQDVKSEIADLLGEDSAAEEAKDTLSPQCEHIVVQAVKSWGGADVTVAELEDTIADVLLQMLGTKNTEEESISDDLESRCSQIRVEIGEVILELETPRVSDQCD